jgi:hypothetical protein
MSSASLTYGGGGNSKNRNNNIFGKKRSNSANRDSMTPKEDDKALKIKEEKLDKEFEK